MSQARRPWRSAAPFIERALRFFSYLPLLGVSAVVAFAKLLIYARLASPEEYGAISQMFLIGNTFGAFGGLGFQLLAHREAPGLYVRRRQFGMVVLLFQGIIVSTASAFAAGVLLVPFALVGALSLTIGGLGLAIGLFYAWTQMCFLIVTIDAKSRLDMVGYSIDIVLRTVASALAGIIVLLAGYHSRTVVFVEAAFTLASFLWIGRGSAARTGIATVRLLRMAARRLKLVAWRAAIVLMLGSALSFLTSAMDRWLATIFLDLRQFGYYSFAWTSIAAAQTFQYLINASLFPLIARRFWAVSSQNAFRLVAILSFGLVAVGAAGAAIIAPFIGLAIHRWFPQQFEATALIEPLLIAAVFRVADFWSSFLIVVRRETLLLNLQIATLAIAAAAYWAATLGRGEAPNAQSLAMLAAGLAIFNFALCGAAAWYSRGAPHR